MLDATPTQPPKPSESASFPAPTFWSVKHVAGSHVSVHIIGELCANTDKTVRPSLPRHQTIEDGVLVCCVAGWGGRREGGTGPHPRCCSGTCRPSWSLSMHRPSVLCRNPAQGQHGASKSRRRQVVVESLGSSSR